MSDPVGEAPTTVLLMGPWLERYAPVLADAISVPARVSHTPLVAQRATEAADLLADTHVLITSVFTRELAALAPRLRLVHVPGAGYDRVDREALPTGVLVAVCYAHEKAIAEFVIMQALVLSRRLFDYDRRLRAFDWSTSMIAGAQTVRELRGRTMGIIGLGRIGREVASHAKYFGMTVVALARDPASARPTHAVDRVHGPSELHTLLAESDVVAVTAPLTEGTRGMIGPNEFAAMKPDALLINAARAPIVDEQALYDALSSNRIGGAALDVWYQYPTDIADRTPPSRFPFETLGNVVMTPHVSGYTDEMAQNRMRAIARNIDRLARGVPLENVIT